MNRTFCTREHEVVTAMKSGELNEKLRSHANGCLICRETVMLAGAMQRLSKLQVNYRLPGHRLIWIRAQYTRRQERLSKLDLVGLIGMAVLGTTILFGTLVWRFPKLFPGIASIVQSSLPASDGGMQVTTPVIVFVVLLVFGWFITRDRFFAER